MLVCVVTCMLTEFVFEAFADRPLAVTDCSAAVTGLLLALMLPVGSASLAGDHRERLCCRCSKDGLWRNRKEPAEPGSVRLLPASLAFF